MRDFPGQGILWSEHLSNNSIIRSLAMTQHLLQQQTEEDQRTMRRLGTVVGAFILATAVMAIMVGAIMG